MKVGVNETHHPPLRTRKYTHTPLVGPTIVGRDQFGRGGLLCDFASRVPPLMVSGGVGDGKIGETARRHFGWSPLLFASLRM